MIKSEILIVGAGPTGLTLANLLAQTGVDFMIIDSKEKPSQDSKAFGIHARSLEVFDRLGLAETLIEEGHIDNTFHILSNDFEAARFKLNKILPGETPFPYFLILPQDRTESILIEKLNQQGKKVYWKHRLTGLHSKGQLYNAEIQDGEGNVHQFQPRYIIGCDGADSTVRRKSGISFKGKSYTSSFNLADVALETTLVHGDVYFSLASNYLSVIFSYKKKDHFRIFNFLNTAVRKNKNERLTVSEVQHILDDNPHLKAKVINMEWSSVYHIHCRVAERFAKGNVLLAGDAAHVHSPVGGQGMNTGIQDAFNLAWKIKWSIEHLHSKALLQSYHEERYPIARNLHNSTDKFFQLLMIQNKVMDLLRVYIFPFSFRLLANKVFLRILFRRVSQIAIKYRHSSLSKNYWSGKFSLGSPKAGDRAPWAEIAWRGQGMGLYRKMDYRYFTLLITGLTSDYQSFKQLLQSLIANPLPLKVYFLAEHENQSFYRTYGVKGAAMYLIRPDGHIGIRSGKISTKILFDYFDSLER
jgi:2-polyprenyl-6-methoxyphenol hydroxylase-like FAD-dependent oxidoreductase